MNIPAFYQYLVRARRDLWPALEALPDEVLSRHAIPGQRFHSIKDLLAHVAAVEDSWLHEDILRDQPVWDSIPAIQEKLEGSEPHFAAAPIHTLLDYWRAVEASTLAYLATLTPEEEARLVTVPGSKGEERFTASGLLWHVMTHELRHVAQIVLLIRQAEVKPPRLELLDHLPTY